jgi:hypothetical protein
MDSKQAAIVKIRRMVFNRLAAVHEGYFLLTTLGFLL